MFTIFILLSPSFPTLYSFRGHQTTVKNRVFATMQITKVKVALIIWLEKSKIAKFFDNVYIMKQVLWHWKVYIIKSYIYNNGDNVSVYFGLQD